MNNKQVVLAIVIGFALFIYIDNVTVPWVTETLCDNVLICE